jgi:shikimate kinase
MKDKLNEASILFSKPDVILNLDKFESGEIDRLFISGFHGAGKSTIGKILAKKMNATFVEIDFHQKEIRAKYGDYMKTTSLYAGKVDTKLATENYSKFVEEKIKEHGRCIFEGTHVMFMDPGYLKDYAVWLVNTSYLVSYVRALIRNTTKESRELMANWSKKKRNPHRFLKFNLSLYKKMSDLEKDLIEFGAETVVKKDQAEILDLKTGDTGSKN